MGQENGACIVIVDKEASPTRRLVESLTHVSSKLFASISDVLRGVFIQNPVAIFIDIEHISKPALAEELHLLKEKWPLCPILAMTSERGGDAILDILRFGVDEFLLKPINGEELVLRLHVKQSQVGKEKERAVMVADILVDPSSRSLKNLANNKVKFLSPIEVNLLSILLSSMGQSISRETVKRKCWGTTTVSDNALNRKLFEVRRALSQIDANLTIKTLYGSGYAIQKINGGSERGGETS